MVSKDRWEREGSLGMLSNVNRRLSYCEILRKRLNLNRDEDKISYIFLVSSFFSLCSFRKNSIPSIVNEFL